ncbi:MAG: chloride channel protein [Candidatus Thorarchaeota archaeon]|nr:chloride channel protein [Candidatus Thorarchaeota archaeon]
MESKEKSENIGESVIPIRELFHFSHFSQFYRLYVPISILIGFFCGLSMVLFQFMIDQSILLLSPLPIYLAPLLGGLLSSVLIYVGFREIEGSGISKAIELTHDPGHLHTRTILTKMVATSVSIGSGNPVGREGPAVLIGAAIGNHVGRKLGFDNPAQLRVFIMMGSAACTAGIYKAPLGGALFASEAPYKRDARVGYFVPTVLAAITSYIVFALLYGINPLLNIQVDFEFSILLVVPVVLFGIIAGVVSLIFSVVLMVSRNAFKIHLPNWADPIAGSFLGCIFIFIVAVLLDPQLTVAGMGYEVISYVATHGATISVGAVLLLLICKLFASSFVVAGKVSGGVLASSIFVGAMLGALFSRLFYPDDLAAFIVLGMGAVLAANTNTPVATTIMVLEISHSFDLLIPLAICICVSYLVAGGSSLYEGQKVTRADEEPGFYANIATNVEDANLSLKDNAANPVNKDEED